MYMHVHDTFAHDTFNIAVHVPTPRDYCKNNWNDLHQQPWVQLPILATIYIITQMVTTLEIVATHSGYTRDVEPCKNIHKPGY